MQVLTTPVLYMLSVLKVGSLKSLLIVVQLFFRELHCYSSVDVCSSCIHWMTSFLVTEFLPAQ